MPETLSQKQLDANRRNALKSTAPTTHPAKVVQRRTSPHARRILSRQRQASIPARHDARSSPRRVSRQCLSGQDVYWTCVCVPWCWSIRE